MLEAGLDDVLHAIIAVALEVTLLVFRQGDNHLHVDGCFLTVPLLHLQQQLAEHLVEVGLEGVEGIPIQGQRVLFVATHRIFLLSFFIRDVGDDDDHPWCVGIELPDLSVHNLGVVPVCDAVQRVADDLADVVEVRLLGRSDFVVEHRLPLFHNIRRPYRLIDDLRRENIGTRAAFSC